MTIRDAKPMEGKDEERTHAGWRKWVKPALLSVVAAVVLLTPSWAPPILGKMDFFRVRHVEVQGAKYLDPADLVARLQLDTAASVWDDSDPLSERVAKHPLVRSVTIERKLPGTLVVRVVEHAPVALVPTTNGFLAYDARGVALPIDPSSSDVDVPIASVADSGILRLLGEARTDAPTLYARLSEVRRDGGEMLIMLDSLPVRTLIDVTLQRLVDLELVERDLARRRVRVTELDLRYRDQVIARFQ